MEVDGGFEVLQVTKTVSHLLDRLDLAIQALTHRVGNSVAEVRQDVGEMPLESSGRFENRLQPAVGGPEVPALPEPAPRVRINVIQTHQVM